MDINEFLDILDVKIKEPYTYNLCNSIINLYHKKDLSYSVEDLQQDTVVYFLTKNRLSKIQNSNGARISIEMYLRQCYRALKGRKKQYADLIKLDIDSMKKYKDMGYEKKHMILHSYLYHNVKPTFLNLNAILFKNGKFNRMMAINETLEVMNILMDIEKDDKTREIYKYFKSNKKLINPESVGLGEFWELRNDGLNRRRDDKILSYLKSVYRKEVDKLLQ